MKKAVVLWTGGKDSCLALHLAREGGFEIFALVTFVPEGGAEFLAHPQAEMREQAEKLGLAIHFLEIGTSYKESYVDGLKWIKESLGAGTVVTGDIDLVDGFPNWIEECCEGTGLAVFRPLWLKSREWVLREVLDLGMKVRISFLNHPALPRRWLNRIIDEPLFLEMKAVSASCGIDLAGENGEYHTMVVDAPAFLTS
jgi:uncharacterized protein (TIGR00290 family)